jgi:hypothetical protein
MRIPSLRYGMTKVRARANTGVSPLRYASVEMTDGGRVLKDGRSLRGRKAGFSPFDYAQGRNDRKKAKAKAKADSLRE